MARSMAARKLRKLERDKARQDRQARSRFNKRTERPVNMELLMQLRASRERHERERCPKCRTGGLLRPCGCDTEEK